MLNVVAIMGRLAADPQLKTTTSGKSVASFRIANDTGYKNADGSSQTNWLDVVAWGKTSEFVCKYFPKAPSLPLMAVCNPAAIRTRTARTVPSSKSSPRMQISRAVKNPLP